MRPVYSDGTYGWYAPRNADVPNSVYSLSVGGDERRTNTQITTDFILNQKLDFVTKGLSFRANLSFDNTMVEVDRGINDQYNDSQRKWINPESGQVDYQLDRDFTETVNWVTQGGNVDRGATFRKLYYQLQLNWARQFGKHDVTAMGLFSREKYAVGSQFPHYREDWVFRATYNYASRYFAEVNGAYNGSEQFGENKRFDFFPSVSLGWMLTEESFMKPLAKYIDMVKIRASWGRIGDDKGGNGRWLHRDEWAYDGNTVMGTDRTAAPYTIYRQTKIGNPNVGWELVEKRNLGIDYGFLGGLITGSLDIFNDHRTDIIITSRAIPSYFGVGAPAANLGKVDSHGFELAVRLNKQWTSDFRTSLNFNMTHAKNKVKFADDPELRAAYLKGEGYAINQTRSYLDHGYIRTWDELYGSPVVESNNDSKFMGDYQIIDFNEAHVAFKEGDYYNVIANNGELPLPRWVTITDNSANGTRYYYDGSFLRLKNAELAYTFHGDWLKRAHLNGLRIYLNGDNLLLWTKMPDDRENNFSGGDGAYPTVRRFNLGLDLTF